MKDKTPMRTSSIVQPANSIPVSGDPRQFESKFKMKLMPASNRNPRHGFCVPMNHAPKIGPVHAPREENTKPRTKMPMIATAANCNQRLGDIFLDILQLFLEVFLGLPQSYQPQCQQVQELDPLTPVLESEAAGNIYRDTIEYGYGCEDHRRGIPGAGGAALPYTAFLAGRRHHCPASRPRAATVPFAARDPGNAGRARSHDSTAGGAAFTSPSQHGGTD